MKEKETIQALYSSMHCTYSNSPHPFTDAATTHGLTVDLFHLSERIGPSLMDNHKHE